MENSVIISKGIAPIVGLGVIGVVATNSQRMAMMYGCPRRTRRKRRRRR